MKTSTPLLGDVGSLAALAVLIVALPFVMSSSYLLRIVALVWVMGLGAIGLHILMGLAGQISLGHAGFFGIGAYATAVLPAHYGVPTPVAALCGLVASTVIAYLVGKPILRLRGHYLAIATLGFSLLVGLVITSEVGLTGGPDGVDVARLKVGGTAITSAAAWYWISGGLLLAGIAVAIVLRESPTGRALRAILDSEVAAASMGVDVARRKLQAFVVAAVYAALAGCTMALMNGFITPDIAGFLTSVEFVAMVVIGGATTPFGAVVGAALLTLLPQVLATFHDYQDIAVGLVIMLSMIFLRQGIVPALRGLVRGGRA
jgi:branched-chain amino acid transport system permease protein